MFKNLNLDKLTVEEMMALLEQGDFNSEDLQRLIKALEKKGIKGMIMAVPDADGQEGQAAREYIEYHQKLPASFPRISRKQIEKSKKVLFDQNSTLEDQKIALITLAHLGRVDIYRTLQAYNNRPHPELVLWAKIALDECQSFLENDLRGRASIDLKDLSA